VKFTEWLQEQAVIGQNESMNDIQRLNIERALARDLESLKWVQELDNEQKQYVLEIFRSFLG
jgi:hypothetical protein